jgi:hypothetical protein
VRDKIPDIVWLAVKAELTPLKFELKVPANVSLPVMLEFTPEREDDKATVIICVPEADNVTPAKVEARVPVTEPPPPLNCESSSDIRSYLLPATRH